MKKLIFQISMFVMAITAYGQSTATYDVVFTSNWEAHGSLPGSNAHFTELVGATHNKDITFLRNGGIATLGVERVAETGSNGTFSGEVNRAINNGTADQYIEGPNLFFNGTGRTITINDLAVSSEYPLVSLLSMIAPSPDWIIAVNSVSLLDTSDEWIQNITLDLFPYDAGTEEGTTYSLNNPATNPKEPISSIRGISPFNSEKIGTLVFTLKSVDTGGGNTSECTTAVTDFPYNQGFESTLGDWSQDTSDDLDWLINSNGTPSRGTGPDSAIEGTEYIYVEASGNTVGFPRKRAIINSPCFDLTQMSTASFTFKYHMFGSNNMGSIDLEVSTDNGANWTSIWNKTGNQGNSWFSENVDLSPYTNTSIKLRFNRLTGTTWQADIAIDDITVTATSSLVTKNSNTITQPLVSKLKIHANPVQDGILNISISNETKGNYTINNLMGKTMHSGIFSNTINVEKLVSGIYLINVKTKDGAEYVERFIKQ
ncbi:spondin domain-containing protein [Aquimarina sp. RZ0]|uniref:spondin domain-containing protein n=1 Tax=Aquimarina sp. RZ0 TaxID=2607730 RepID=UPI0011F0D484|nr:spondin domain-containing protein [Aquimarina sp. RZ0]KAA1244599.1 T9SS type A sorting domain-containing protein [Aquimarina sp. RZ0]